MPPSSDDLLLFGARTHTRRIEVDDLDRPTGSRIGGAPPASLPASRCPRCSNPMRYVATLEHDTLGVALASGRALSLLACSGPCVLRGLGPGGGFAVVVHPPSARGSTAPTQWAPVGRGLAASAVLPDAGSDPGGAGPFRGAKIGGRPWFVDEPIEVDDDAAFLVQLPDDVGPSATGGIYLLGGTGTIFVYGRTGPDGISLDGASVEVELG